MRYPARALALGLALAFGGAHVAAAADINVVCAGAMRAVVQQLAAPFEQATGNHLAFTFGTAGDVEKRLAAHEAFDVAIGTKPRLQNQEKAGIIVAGSIAVVGRSPIALAVKQGAAKPDIGTVDAFKKAMLAAQSIAYTDPASGGTSGIHMAKVMHDLGIADAVEAKTRRITGQPGAPPAVGEAIAHGEAEIGLQPISELTGVAGIEIVGTLPDALQTPDLTYAAALTANSQARDAGAAFIKYLTGPSGEAAVKAKGLIPGDGG